MISNRSAANKSVYSYQEIGRMIHAHLHYLNEHKKQLIKIRLPQPFGIEEKEADEYFSDTVGKTPDEIKVDRNTYLSILQSVLNSRVLMFKILSEICDHPENEKNILLLFFMLKYSLKSGELIAKPANIDHHDILVYLGNVFSEASQLSFLLNQTKKILPASYAAISKAILIEESKGIVARAGQDIKKTLHEVDCVEICSHQEAFINLYLNVFNAFQEGKIHRYKDLGSRISIIATMNDFSKTLAHGSAELAQLPEPKKIFDSQAIYNARVELSEKLDVTISLKAILDELKYAYDFEKNQEHNYELACEAIKEKIEKYEKAINRSNRIVANLKSKKRHPGIKATKQDFNDLKIEVSRLLGDLKKEFQLFNAMNFLNIDACAQQEEEIYKISFAIRVELKRMDSAIKLIKKLSRTKPASKVKSVAQPVSSQNEKKNVKTEREQYLEQEKLKTIEYREKVEEKRKEKGLNQRTSPGLLASPSLSVFSTTSPGASLSVSEDESSNGSSAAKSQIMSERLRSLSAKHFELLGDILNCKPGVKYRNVISLITNQLGGVISEIGNGSSHKRIHLEKLYFEVSSKNAENPEESQRAPLSAGGFYRPHGKSHSSGYMSSFNLGLVADAFEKAGITLEVLESLRHSENTKYNSL